MPQGRFLNTPELIPFRLTRDIVDGFGIAGAVSSQNSEGLHVHQSPILESSWHYAPDVGAQAWRG